MLDIIQKLTYRAKANIPNAAAALKERLCDRRELPLDGIHGERLFLTGVSQLEQQAAQLQVLYGQLPTCRNSGDNILLDAWASASIEGAEVSLPEVKKNLSNPQTGDENMLPNAQLIRQADTIWIQANALSHAYFYRIITEARKYDIPVRYFSFASAEKCAEQLAFVDIESN